MTIARTDAPTLYVFHAALDDTRHPARYVVTVVAEDEDAARRALYISRRYETVAWISCIGTEDDYINRENNALADAFNNGHALGMADARLEDA